MLAILRQIHDEYWGGYFAYDPLPFVEKIAKFGECAFAVDDNSGETLGGVFGYCNNVQDGLAYISFLGRIKSAPRGTGLFLHRNFSELAVSRGMNRIQLEVSKINVNAVEFYKHVGYVPVADRGKKFLMELTI